MLFLVGLGSCLSLVGATLGTHYLTGCHQVSGTFLKIVDSGLFLVGFFSLLKSSTFAHLRVISIGCRSSLLLHLCRHHPLMTFLVIKVDRTINNLLTLVMKETLDRPLVYYFFILVNGCIEESFIVFHFWRLYGLESLITMLCLVDRHLAQYLILLFLMHLLFSGVHLVPLGVREHVLRWNLLLLLFCNSFIWSLLHRAKIGLLNRVKCIVAIYRVVSVLNPIMVNGKSPLGRTSVWRIEVLMLWYWRILLRKILRMWFYYFARLFAHLGPLFTLNHQFLLLLEVLVLRVYHLIYLASSTDSISLKILVRCIWRMNIAAWQASFSSSCSLGCNLLREVYSLRIKIGLAQILSYTNRCLWIPTVALGILLVFRGCSQVIHL
jgi:hypothetical protein